jgi:wobble nucleotide-excising tRNase
MFQNGAWNRTLPNMVIFDDLFVDQNIYSGLTVASEHRQNLHELILGSQMVTRNQTLKELVDRVEEHNAALRTKAAAIPAAERGRISVDDFCALPVQADIDDAIQAVERRLAAAREQDPIRNNSVFSSLDLPSFNIAEIDGVLEQDLPTLDAVAAERVKTHLAALGQDAETWVAGGMERIPSVSEGQTAAVCPFCAQDMQDSPVLNHYRAYFSREYANLKRAVSTALASVNRAHGGDVPAAFERAVRITAETRQFWARFCEIPDINLDTAAIVTKWQSARDAVATTLAAKQMSPLERMTLTGATRDTIAAYQTSRQTILDLNQTLQEANVRIQQVKQQAVTANTGALSASLELLRAIKVRHTAAIDPLCVDYLNEKVAKTATEEQRDQARAVLDEYRTRAFPAFQRTVNPYLTRFNAGFTLDNVCSANTRGGSTCTYNVVINNTAVSIAGGTPVPGSPSFRNTLSAGDRNTLAFAFFLASLDQDTGLAAKVVVIDDPISSMDEHRALTTVQVIRRLAQRANQVIVLSHSKPFLCNIWEGADQAQRAALQVTRDTVGSTISEWDVNQDCISEHDRRHTLLREYMRSNSGNTREIAHAIRPSLEAFMRVACPEHFPPGTMLGVFRGLCEQRTGTAQEILDAATTQELRDLIEYANRFHHDTNPAWETVVINDSELQGFVYRTLEFAKR